MKKSNVFAFASFTLVVALYYLQHFSIALRSYESVVYIEEQCKYKPQMLPLDEFVSACFPRRPKTHLCMLVAPRFAEATGFDSGIRADDELDHIIPPSLIDYIQSSNYLEYVNTHRTLLIHKWNELLRVNVQQKHVNSTAFLFEPSNCTADCNVWRDEATVTFSFQNQSRLLDLLDTIDIQTMNASDSTQSFDISSVNAIRVTVIPLGGIDKSAAALETARDCRVKVFDQSDADDGTTAVHRVNATPTECGFHRYQELVLSCGDRQLMLMTAPLTCVDGVPVFHAMLPTSLLQLTDVSSMQSHPCYLRLFQQPSNLRGACFVVDPHRNAPERSVKFPLDTLRPGAFVRPTSGGNILVKLDLLPVIDVYDTLEKCSKCNRFASLDGEGVTETAAYNVYTALACKYDLNALTRPVWFRNNNDAPSQFAAVRSLPSLSAVLRSDSSVTRRQLAVALRNRTLLFAGDSTMAGTVADLLRFLQLDERPLLFLWESYVRRLLDGDNYRFVYVRTRLRQPACKFTTYGSHRLFNITCSLRAILSESIESIEEAVPVADQRSDDDEREIEEAKSEGSIVYIRFLFAGSKYPLAKNQGISTFVDPEWRESFFNPLLSNIDVLFLQGAYHDLANYSERNVDVASAVMRDYAPVLNTALQNFTKLATKLNFKLIWRSSLRTGGHPLAVSLMNRVARQACRAHLNVDFVELDDVDFGAQALHSAYFVSLHHVARIFKMHLFLNASPALNRTEWVQRPLSEVQVDLATMQSSLFVADMAISRTIDVLVRVLSENK